MGTAYLTDTMAFYRQQRQATDKRMKCKQTDRQQQQEEGYG